MPAKNRDTQFKPGETGNPNGRPKGSKNRPSTLNLDDAMMAVRLERKGHSPSRIARLLDAKPEAVKDAIANGRKLLDQFNPEMARYWRIAAARAAKKGDHRPAMAAMQSTKAIEPIAQTYDTGAQGGKAVAAVKVELHGFTFAGLPTQPQGEEPKTIDVTARSGT